MYSLNLSNFSLLIGFCFHRNKRGHFYSMTMISVMMTIISAISELVLPYAKRYTYYTQMLIGFSVNCLAIGIRSALIKKDIVWHKILPLVSANILINIIAETVYSSLRDEEYLRLGFKSISLKWCRNIKQNLYLIASIKLILLLIFA